jgi:hypothetical protein
VGTGEGGSVGEEMGDGEGAGGVPNLGPQPWLSIWFKIVLIDVDEKPSLPPLTLPSMMKFPASDRCLALRLCPNS